MKSSVEPSELRLKVHLYGEPSSNTLDLQEVAGYLKEKLGKISVDVRGPLVAATSSEDAESLARKLAEAKVRDLTNPSVRTEPLPGEVEFELKLLRDPSLRSAGVLYDGFRLHAVVQELLPAGELDMDHAHIVFTNRLFGTWDEGDGRYHARVSIYGFPSLISTTGIVEAPAKPKEYYILKQRYAALGGLIPLEELKERFRGRFIDYDDERLTEVMKGYVMQALFYHLTLDPFCSDKRCRLYNAHWQEEVLGAQLSQPEFCERHSEMLEKLKRAFEGNP
jgi:hypothetical protein